MVSSFYYNDPKYFICCGNRHIKTAFAIILALSILGTFSSLISLITDKDAASVLALFINLIVAITLVLTFKTENEKFLYPYIGITILAVPLSFVAVLYLVVMSKDFKKSDQKGAMVGALIFSLIIANAVNAWFLFIIYKYYKFLIDLRAFRLSQNTKPAVNA